LGLVLAAGLIEPIKVIDHGVSQLGQGRFDVRLPPFGNDELGRLCEAFNKMAEGLQKMDRLETYVSEEVIEAVKRSATSETDKGQIVEATILFSDIRDFTSHSENHPPEVIFKMLNSFLSGVDPIIREHGGRVDKFIGDAIMVVFRAKEHPHQAIRAAVAMMRFVDTFNRQRLTEQLFPIQIGVGISTGKVLLGGVGSELRKDLTVIGDEVNLAARLEKASKLGRYSKIVISEATFQFSKEIVEVDLMETTAVKGKQQTVRMYELIKLREEKATQSSDQA